MLTTAHVHCSCTSSSSRIAQRLGHVSVSGICHASWSHLTNQDKPAGQHTHLAFVEHAIMTYPSKHFCVLVIQVAVTASITAVVIILSPIPP